jgi:hypothetical protein
MLIKKSVGNPEKCSEEEVMVIPDAAFYYYFRMADHQSTWPTDCSSLAIPSTDSPRSTVSSTTNAGHLPKLAPGHVTFNSILLMGGSDSCDKIDTVSAIVYINDIILNGEKFCF